MHIFLDFDGVLHPKGAGQRRFTKLALLESFLREPAVSKTRIVISSTWREAYSLPELRAFFSPDISIRVIDVTPALQDYATNYERGEEIEAWLRGRPAAPWIAIDDDVTGFAPDLRKRLVLCHGEIGLREQDLELARSLLNGW